MYKYRAKYQCIMKQQLDKILKHFAFIILGLSTVTLGFMFYKLTQTKSNVAKSLVEKTLFNSSYELSNFITPFSNHISYSVEELKTHPFSEWTPEKFNHIYFSVIKKNKQLQAVGIATNKGLEYNIVKKEDVWQSRMLDPSIDNTIYFWNKYKVRGSHPIKDSSWTSKTVNDPRDRPWYIGAKNTYPEKFWSDLYIFNTTHELGITVSQSWKDSQENDLEVTLAYDISLQAISGIIKKIKPTKNSQVMIANGNNYLLYDDKTESIHIVDLNTNKQQAKLHQLSVDNLDSDPFQFEKEGQNWWGSSEEFKLTNSQKLNMVIILPESDFLKEINNLQVLLFIGFIVIILLTFLIVRMYNKQAKYNHLLLQNGNIIKTKNIEIISSINCAKRIQNAMLPDDEEIQRCLGESFIIYLPKDIVAGDFYWIHYKHPYAFFAVGDCTGHGVPGAMISVMCQTALNRAVLEFSLVKPNEILDKTKELFIEQFNIHNNRFSDGMDISFCLLNKENNKLSWAGANNPLYIIKKDSQKIKVLNPDRQPIGRFPKAKPFSLKEIQLEKGDRLYLFTDGFQDQFGGPKLKKLKPKLFRELLVKTSSLSISDQRKTLIKAFREWKGNEEQVDDVCLLCVKI